VQGKKSKTPYLPAVILNLTVTAGWLIIGKPAVAVLLKVAELRIFFSIEKRQILHERIHPRVISGGVV